MNMVLICNLIFYFSPYIPMSLYDLRNRTPDWLKWCINGLGTILLMNVTCISLIGLFYYGYVRDGKFVILFDFIPTYLLVFYTLSGLISILSLYIAGQSCYDSLLLGFLIAYVNSFYWELPENIFWQLKRGYHPAIIFTVLGAFPYIWLNKKLGWEKSKKNYLLVLLGWATTTFGVLTMESNVYTTPTGALYFLFCRIVCLLILIKIFVVKDVVELNPKKWVIYLKWICVYLLRGDWKLGTEMAYWDYEINYARPGGWCLPTIRRYLCICLDRISTRFMVTGREIKVLELGPGPRSRLTELYDKGMFDLVAVDPLADEFKDRLGGREFLFQACGEYMDFPPETYHLSYASNVLDHSQDIEKCLDNMVRVTKVGGLILIQGNIREGERLNWMGLHKYSTWIEDGNLMYRTKDGGDTNLTDDSRLLLAGHRERLLEGNPWYSVIYRREK